MSFVSLTRLLGQNSKVSRWLPESTERKVKGLAYPIRSDRHFSSYASLCAAYDEKRELANADTPSLSGGKNGRDLIACAAEDIESVSRELMDRRD